VAIEAPEGMGKHRLLAELRREVQLGGGLFVSGSYWSGETGGLGPFANVVLQLATALGEHSELVSRYEGLIQMARSAQSVDDAAAAQLSEFLLEAAKERPYVLYLADVDRAPARF